MNQNIKILIKIVLLIWVVLPELTYSQALDSREGDEAALQALYTSTNGDNWDNTTGWNGGNVDLSNPPVHVITEQIDGEWRVRQINLHASDGIVMTEETRNDFSDYGGGNNLVGELPIELGNLKKLTHLRVKGNTLTGTISHFVPFLESAVYLSFAALDGYTGQNERFVLPRNRFNHPGKGGSAYNQFSGEIPDLDVLTNLEIFELAHQPNIIGTLPKLPDSIVGLFIHNSSMSGTLPTWSNCVNLTHLYIGNDTSPGAFTGEVPPEWNNMDISWLYLQGNDLSGEFPEMLGWTDMRFIEIAGSGLTVSTFPSWMYRDDNINPLFNAFVMGYVGMTGELPETIEKNANFSELLLPGNNLTGTLPEWIFDYNPIQISVGGNNFTGSLPNGNSIDKSKLRRIRNIKVFDNDLSGPLPTGEFAESINVLEFNSNRFSGPISPPSWESLKNSDRSVRIWLMDNELEGVVAEWYAEAGSLNGGSLRELRVHQNKLTPKDILPHREAIEAAVVTEYVYLPQKPFGSSETLSDGSTIDRSSFHYSGNRYQWYKDGSPVNGETSHSINTSSYGTGTYVLEITHPDINYTFESEPIEVTADGGGSTDEPTAPAAPSLQSPSSGAINVYVNPTFSWSSVSADSYTLRIYTSGGSLVFENTGSGTSYSTPSGRTLDHDTEYSWRVRATRDGLNSEWSSSRSFTTESDNDGNGGDDGSGGGPGPSDPDGDVLQAPNVQSPADGATDVSLTPTLEWSHIEGADSYILHVSATNPSEMVIEETVAGNNFTPKTPLVAERNHQWRVRGVKDGVEGEWSTIAEFTTQSENGGNGNNGKGPQKATPAKDEKKVKKNATFTWEPVEGAESYTIEIRESATSSLFVGEEVTDTVYVSSQRMKGNTVYTWRVRATIEGQTGEWSDEWEFTTEDENEETVFVVELDQNYPNPFNPSTNIRFTIAEQQEVSLKVYDMAGRLVASLVDGSMLSAGTHSASFNAQSLASGIYFYRLITPTEIVTRKMTLMK